MFITFTVFTILMVVVTVLPMTRINHWIVRGWDFPRFQLMTLSAILIAFILVFLDATKAETWVMLAAVAFCFVWQMWWIVPYTPLWPREVKTCRDIPSDHTMSIITANVLKTNRNSEALIKLVRQYEPDVLVTLESDAWWQKQLAVLEADMPHTLQCPLDNLYGMHLYSRLPILDREISFLVEDDVPSFHVALELRSGDRVRAHFVHPAPPSPTENTESTERDAELVIVGKSVADSEAPVVVSGDLNDVAWSSTTRLFRKLSGLLDPRIGRGMFNTFHAKYPLLRWPLDHLFHSDHFTLCTIKRLPSIGSDHFPLFATLALTPTTGDSQRGLDADSDDRERAEEMANEEGVDEDQVPKPETGNR